MFFVGSGVLEPEGSGKGETTLDGSTKRGRARDKPAASSRTARDQRVLSMSSMCLLDTHWVL